MMARIVLAYRLKEDFFKIYDARTRNDALVLFANWEMSVTHEVRDAFSDLIRTWHYWQLYILNYFDYFRSLTVLVSLWRSDAVRLV
jgi:transposase